MSNSKFKKEDIIAVLKSVLKEDQIVNINNFNNEVLLDIIPSNPTHKAKSELSKTIIETLKNDYNSSSAFGGLIGKFVTGSMFGGGGLFG